MWLVPNGDGGRSRLIASRVFLYCVFFLKCVSLESGMCEYFLFYVLVSPIISPQIYVPLCVCVCVCVTNSIYRLKFSLA
jgi:hypothetical protein